jgi:hypothetical protein
VDTTTLLENGDAREATARLCAMATFRDDAASRRQIGAQLGVFEATFARCLAMSGWAIEKPLRMIVFGLPMHASLDDCLLARLADAGHRFAGLDDETLQPCLDSRWEFLRGSESSPARYRPAPSYNQRLRVQLLTDAWERASRGGDVDLVDMIAAHLAQATLPLGPRLALPLSLLRRAADERRVDAAADGRLRHQLRKSLIAFERDDIRFLAISAALEGSGDVGAAVRRHGDAAMRILLRAHAERASPIGARATLHPRLVRLRREIWCPLAAG